MSDNSRLVSLLESYGSIEEGRFSPGGRPFREGDDWVIPLDEGRALVLHESDLPPAAAGLLALYVESSAPADEDDGVQAWLAGEGKRSGDELADLLKKRGWQDGGALVAVVEWSQEGDDLPFDDAVSLLEELLDGEQAVLAPTGNGRICLLLSTQGVSRDDELWRGGNTPLSAWLDTIGAELYLLYRAGVSSTVSELREVVRARDEAEFAFEAGKLYRSQERIHRYERLGIARLLYGMQAQVREDFLREVLPGSVLESLSQEMRETIFSFLEHGGQVADTARSLYIHRNTLLYRLDRIAELTGHDIRKPLQAWTLWLALSLSRIR